MLQESLARGHERAHRPEAYLRRGEQGATTSEYLVIAGVVVAIVLAVAATFKSEISTALDILGCQIGVGAAGGTGGCGGGTSASTAGSWGNPAGTGGSSGGTNPGQPFRPGQLVPVGGPLPSAAGAPGVPGRPAGSGSTGPSGPGTNPASLAGTGPMAPGGPTVSSNFGTRGAVLSAIGRTGDTVFPELVDLWAATRPDPIPFTGSDPMPLTSVPGVINSTTARYGNWVGSGWSGGSEMNDKVGAMPPIDALDALGQAHDFGYAIAEEAGELYGDAEKYRLQSIADEIGYQAWKRLNPDPAKWVPPPPDIEKARAYYKRFEAVMQTMGSMHDWQRRNASPPTPAQLAALRARGPITASQLSAEQNRRVQAWNKDRGVDMRSRGAWK